MATFLLEIVTPDRVAYSEQVDMVVVPGLEGQMGILPHHIPLFAQLTHGEVKIVKGKEDIYLAIGGGYVEVMKDKVEVLVTRAKHTDELDEKEILEARARAEKILKEKPEGEDMEAAEQLLRSTLVDLKLFSRRKRRAS